MFSYVPAGINAGPADGGITWLQAESRDVCAGRRLARACQSAKVTLLLPSRKGIPSCTSAMSSHGWRCTANNQNACFNWFEPVIRRAIEVKAIDRQMVDAMMQGIL